MADDAQEKKLPGNHGQFGVNNATEEHKQLDDAPPPVLPSNDPGKPTTKP